MWICLKDPAFVDQLIAATGIGIWVRGVAVREVDRRLRAKDAARVKRREILQAWGVRSSSELQQALVEHLQKVRYDATRLELDRQATELEERAQVAGRSLRELVGSWGLPQPAPINWKTCNSRSDSRARSGSAEAGSGNKL